MYRSSPFRSTLNTGYIRFGHVWSMYRGSPFRSTLNTNAFKVRACVKYVATFSALRSTLNANAFKVRACVRYVPRQWGWTWPPGRNTTMNMMKPKKRYFVGTVFDPEAWICYVCVWHDSRKWYVMLFNILCAIDDEISETNFFRQKGNQAGQCQIWQFIWTLLTLLSCVFSTFVEILIGSHLYMHLNLVNPRQKPYSTWVFSTELVDQRKDEVRVEALPVFFALTSITGWVTCRILSDYTQPTVSYLRQFRLCWEYKLGFTGYHLPHLSGTAMIIYVYSLYLHMDPTN